MNLPRAVTTALAGTAGLALGAALGALGAIRRNRPVHSVGSVVPGTLVVDAPGSTGSPLFDTAGEAPVTARLSRSASWPIQLPDVMGVALRVQGGGRRGGPADLLFASTGTGVLTRYVLQLHSRVTEGPLTTMLPLAGPEGNIVFRLDPDGANDPDASHEHGAKHFRLSYSRNSGPWEPLGEVVLSADGGAGEASIEPTQRSDDPAGPDDPHLRFRPVAQTPAGLVTPPWLRAARAPAYGIARLVWRP
ncbi:hypothetical protein GCM10022261_20330 [Brevibacterium daeguense]|uniref:Phosphodiesterase n=1 Tax=Brevibacterium daeguense TaxID=909936 RepID=A0ABP8EKJ5_9MICO|nr:hypothetical protein [Brevibacterium daeguense]